MGVALMCLEATPCPSLFTVLDNLRSEFLYSNRHDMIHTYGLGYMPHTQIQMGIPHGPWKYGQSLTAPDLYSGLILG